MNWEARRFFVCRFFDVQSGSVRVGGADVRIIPKEELMDIISFVFQNSRLLKGSILDNVRLGRPQTTEAEVLAALKAAQCMPTWWICNQQARIRRSEKNRINSEKVLHSVKNRGIFINAIYLYDDKVLIAFNYKEGTEDGRFRGSRESREKFGFVVFFGKRRSVS